MGLAVVQHEQGRRLDRPAAIDRRPAPAEVPHAGFGRADLEVAGEGLADVHVAGPVHHQPHRPVLPVLHQQHQGPEEVGVPQVPPGDQHPPAEGVRGPVFGSVRPVGPGPVELRPAPAGAAGGRVGVVGGRGGHPRHPTDAPHPRPPPEFPRTPRPPAAPSPGLTETARSERPGQNGRVRTAGSERPGQNGPVRTAGSERPEPPARPVRRPAAGVAVIDRPAPGAAMAAEQPPQQPAAPAAAARRAAPGAAHRDAVGRTVAAMDVLAPGIGEIIGGSQREERLDVLDARMTDIGVEREAYDWYRRPPPLRHRPPRRLRPGLRADRHVRDGDGERPRCDPVPPRAGERGVLNVHATRHDREGVLSPKAMSGANHAPTSRSAIALPHGRASLRRPRCGDELRSDLHPLRVVVRLRRLADVARARHEHLDRD